MRKLIAATLFLWVLLMGCNTTENKTTTAEDKKLKVVCTTSIIADVLKNVAQDKIELQALMGYGVDPHLYKATQGDLETLQEADIVFYNGVHLEGRMGDVLEKLAKKKTVLPISKGFSESKLINNSDFTDGHDPHIWFDIDIWKSVTSYMTETLTKEDKQNAETYKTGEKKYIARLDSLDKSIANQVQQIADSNRIIITSHDALNYYSRKYDFKMRSLQGSSTAAEFGLKDISNLVDFIVEHKLKSIFAENIVSPQALEAVIKGCADKGHTVTIGGKLYSDALGPKGSTGDTYIGMLGANTKTLIEALK